MKSPLESRITVLQAAIAKVAGQIAAVQVKEDKYRARRQKLEQRLKTLEGKLFGLVNASLFGRPKSTPCERPGGA